MNATTDTPSGVLNVGQNDFENIVLASSEPVLVDFWADWCGPCRMIAPVLERLALEYKGKVKFTKVAVDENESLCAEYGIRSIPALLLFKDGKQVDQVIGAVSRTFLTEKLNAHLLQPGAKSLDDIRSMDSFTSQLTK
jgi:thioredoxin 1